MKQDISTTPRRPVKITRPESAEVQYGKFFHWTTPGIGLAVIELNNGKCQLVSAPHVQFMDTTEENQVEWEYSPQTFYVTFTTHAPWYSPTGAHCDPNGWVELDAISQACAFEKALEYFGGAMLINDVQPYSEFSPNLTVTDSNPTYPKGRLYKIETK